MDNDAIQLRGIIHGISFRINHQITILGEMIDELERAGQEAFSLRSGRSDVINASGLLINRVSPDLETTRAQLVQIRQVLEDWENSIV